MFSSHCSVRVLRSISLLSFMRMAQNLCTQSNSPICSRLINVTGSEGKQNDIIVCEPSDAGRCKQHIIFFGGDVQVRLILYLIILTSTLMTSEICWCESVNLYDCFKALVFSRPSMCVHMYSLLVLFLFLCDIFSLRFT